MSFFTQEESSGRLLGFSVRGCHACKLHDGCDSPYHKAYGTGKKPVLFIGRTGVETETLLMGSLRRFRMDLDDCRKVPALGCKPPRDMPTQKLKKAIDLCRPEVIGEIERFQPKIIIPLGPDALYSLIGHYYGAVGQFQSWRGWQIPDREHNAWICPVFHPAYVRSREKKTHGAAKLIFDQDLKRALQCGELPKFEYDIEILEDKRDIIHFLKAMPRTPFAYDFETTGVKPYAPGHDIRVVGISQKVGHGVSFSLEDDDVLELFLSILENPEYPKIMQNAKFEKNWTNVLFDCDPVNVIWDTMLSSHALNNAKVSGLKFQAYVRFGHPDYSSHISPFLKSKGTHTLNTVFDAPFIDLCRYCAMDAAMTYELAYIQMEEFDYEHSHGNEISCFDEG